MTRAANLQGASVNYDSVAEDSRDTLLDGFAYFIGKSAFCS